MIKLLVEYAFARAIDILLCGFYESGHIDRRFGSELLLLDGGIQGTQIGAKVGLYRQVGAKNFLQLLWVVVDLDELLAGQ